MANHHPLVLLGAVITKGVVMGLLVGAAAISFAQQLTLVIVSASVTGIFALLVVWYSERTSRQVHERLDRMEQRDANVAAAVGADPEPPPDPHPAPGTCKD